jgi:deoxyadenosine/deoxycytidine kinase
MILVAVEGIIGAGKTTLAERLEDRINESGRARAILVTEPTQDDSPWLKRYYEDQKRWAFHTQLAMLINRAQMVRWAVKSEAIADIVIFDRSIVGDKMFAYANHQLGYMSDDEMNLYSAAHTMLIDTSYQSSPIDCVLHVKTEVSDAMSGILERGRASEDSVTPEYQRLLSEGLSSLLSDLPCRLLEVERLPLGEAYELQVNRLADHLCDQSDQRSE